MSAQIISCRLNRFYAFSCNDMSSEAISCLLNFMVSQAILHKSFYRSRPFFLLTQSKYVGKKDLMSAQEISCLHKQFHVCLSKSMSRKQCYAFSSDFMPFRAMPFLLKQFHVFSSHFIKQAFFLFSQSKYAGKKLLRI